MFAMSRLRPAFGVRPVADFVSLFCCFRSCIHKTRVLSNARRGGGGGQERAFGEITERIDFSTTPLVARNGSAGGRRRGGAGVLAATAAAARRHVPPRRPPGCPLPARRSTYVRVYAKKLYYTIVSAREGCAP